MSVLFFVPPGSGIEMLRVAIRLESGSWWKASVRIWSAGEGGGTASFYSRLRR
jgi:hypothetical protein